VLHWFVRHQVRFVVTALFSVSIRPYLDSSGNFSGVREWHHSTTRSIQCHTGPVLHVRPLQACLKSGAQSSFLPDVRSKIRLRNLLMYSWGVVGAVHFSLVLVRRLRPSDPILCLLVALSVVFSFDRYPKSALRDLDPSDLLLKVFDLSINHRS